MEIDPIAYCSYISNKFKSNCVLLELGGMQGQVYVY
jgi:hypothetical protein